MNKLLDPLCLSSSRRRLAFAVIALLASISATALAARVSTPSFNPGGGNYTASQSVTITTSTTNATIYYTTNGTTPTTSSLLYSQPVTISSNTTLKAFAIRAGDSNSNVRTATYVINLAVAAPQFSVATGTYTAPFSLTLTSSTVGASIYYTTDGSTPTASSTLYTNPISVSQSGTIRAIAIKTGTGSSSVTSATYTFAAATPQFSPGAGAYTSFQNVAITSATAGASIYYTTDGSTPTASSTPYTGTPIPVTTTLTLKAIAIKSGLSNSAIGSANFSIDAAVAAPTFSPPEGFYSTPQNVTLSTTTPGASIRYTTDGSTPTDTYGTLSDGTPVTVSPGTTLKAIAFAPSMMTSTVTTGIYTGTATVATPTFSVPGGSYASAQSISINTTTAGATIRYTTDGSTPSATYGTVYTGSPISIPTSATLKAVAAIGSVQSGIASSDYLINNQVIPPAFTPNPGTYNTRSLPVSLSSATSGATIYYTTDGTTPTTSSPVYSSELTLTATTNFRAIAVKAGMTNSVETTAAFTLDTTCKAPTFSVPAGSYSSAQLVALSSTTLGASIRYTTDGSTPTATSGTLYSSPIVISASQTLRAIAFQTGFTDSSVNSASYSITATNAEPSFLPPGGNYTESQDVNLFTALANATIRYTTDGTDPSATNGAIYSGPIPVSSTTTIKAITLQGGSPASAVVSASYTIAPNLLTDVSFEGAVTATGFESFVGVWKRFPIDGITQSRMTVSSSAARTGSQSQQITVTRLMNGNPRLSLAIPGGITAGRDYEASVWVKSAKRNARVTLCVHNANNWFPTNYYSAEREVGQDWTRITLRFRASRSYANVLLGVFLAEENTIWVDDASFRVLSAGDRPPASPAGNLFRYSSFETGTAGWKSNGVALTSVDATVTAPFHGARSGRFSWNGGTGNTLQSLGLDLAWGRPYTVSFYAKASSAGLSLAVSLASGTRNLLTQNVTTTTGWTRYSLTFIPEPTPDGIYYLNIDPPDTGTLYLDAVEVEAGDNPTAYAPFAPVEAELNLNLAGRANPYYPTGEAVTGTLSLFNNGAATSVNLRRRVRDLWDNVVGGSATTWSQSLPAGRTDVPLTVLAAGSTTGAFRAECDVADDTTSPYAEALFSVFRSPVSGSSALGTVLDYNTTGHTGVRAAGFAWTKTWRLDWTTAQPTSTSSLAFTTAQDNIVNTWTTAGLKPLGILSPAPTWAQVTAVTWGWSNPTDFAKQTAYAQAAVTRYGAQVPVWELQNEPNQEVQATSDQTRATAYALEAVALANGAWAANASTKLLLGSLTTRDEFRAFFNEIINSQPALKALDPATGKPKLYGVSFHFYTGDPAIIRRSAADIRAMLADQGLSGLKIWDTEWSPIDDAQTMKRAELRGLTRYSPSPRRAAALVAQGFVSRLGEGIENSILYDTYNPGSMSTVGHKVLYELDGAFRPTAAAAAALAPVTTGALRHEAAAWPGLWAYRTVRSDGRPVTIVWTDDYQAETATVPYTTPEAVTATNMMGNDAGTYSAGATVPVGPAPVYLLGSLGAVTGLTALPSDGKIALSWDAYPGAASYTVQYGPTSGSYANTASSMNLTTTTLSGLANGTPLYFLVSARDSSGTVLAYSVQASATPAASAGVRRDYWTGLSGSTIASLTGNATYPDAPTGTDTLSSLRATQWAGAATKDWADNYGQRLRAWIIAPETGAYVFWVSGDDSTELWLSPDTTATGRVKIAWNTLYTNQDEWNKYTTQRSTNNAFTFNGGAPGVVNLVAGQRYYVEVLHKENTGGDHVSVGWRKPSDGAGSNPAEIVSAITPWTSAPAVPSTPTSLTANATSTQISLAWAPVAGASSYTIKRSSSPSSGFFSIATSATTAFDDPALAPGATYYYRVSAVNANGESADSASATATTWTALQVWREAQFGTLSAPEGTETADPDGDGLSNLFEYAFGSDPNTPNNPPNPSLGVQGNFLTLSFPRIADPRLVYLVDATTSVGTNQTTTIWQSTGAANTPGSTTVTDTQSTTSQPARFLRLKVTY